MNMGYRFWDDRRGTVELGLKELIELVLAILVIVFGWLVISNAYSFFAAEDIADLSSINNFNRLYETMNEMLESDDPFIRGTMPYYIDEEYGVMAFDHDWTRKDATGKINLQWGMNWHGPVYRPDVCGNQACLCLYKGEIEVEDVQDEHLVTCRLFEKPVTFLSPYKDWLKLTQGRPWLAGDHPQFCGAERKDFRINISVPVIDNAIYGYYAIMGDNCGVWTAQKIYVEKIHITDVEGGGPIFFYSDIVGNDSRNRSTSLLPMISSPVYHLGDKEKLTVKGIIDKWGLLIGEKIAAVPAHNRELTKSLNVGVIAQESKGVASEVAYNGAAAGLYMFTPPTAETYAEKTVNGKTVYPGSYRSGHFTSCQCGESTCGEFRQPSCNPQNDDRMNPSMAATAANHYLHDLLTHFDAYTDKQRFAVAGYNAGQSRIDTAITSAKSRYGTQDPSWGQVASVIPIHTAWGKEVVKHIPHVFAFKEEADKILGT